MNECEFKYQVLYPLDGGDKVIVTDEKRELKITFTIGFPFDNNNQEAIDFILNDIVPQMKAISKQYDALDVNQYIN